MLGRCGAARERLGGAGWKLVGPGSLPAAGGAPCGAVPLWLGVIWHAAHPPAPACRPLQDPHQAPEPADDVDGAQWFPVSQLRGLPGAPRPCCLALALALALLPASARGAAAQGAAAGLHAAMASLRPWQACGRSKQRCQRPAADLVVHCDRVAERAVKHYAIRH